MIKHFYLLLSIIVVSCSNTSESVATIDRMYDSQFVFPSNLEYQISGKHFNPNIFSFDYRIVTYIDSSECTPCKMHLNSWDKTLNYFASNSHARIDFLMILGRSQSSEINYEINKHRFRHPIGFDSKKQFHQINNLPAQEKFNTYLLDNNNHVLAIGNPALNPKIRGLYQQIIGDNDGEFDSPHYLCVSSTYPTGAIILGDSVSTSFKLTNKQNNSFTIQEITTSCYCTTAKPTSDSLPIGKSTKIIATHIADSPIGPFNHKIHLFFNETDTPEILTIHGYTLPNS